MTRLAVLNVVGLSERHLGPHTPHLNEFRRGGRFAHIHPAFPAVTCTAQSNYLTGQPPARHGVVANGWYHRELAEVQFWRQSNHLVQAPKVWEHLRATLPGFTCAQLFWWFNMYAKVDWSITPRPIYPADGRKVFDIYTWPYSIRPEIKQDLGEFPFPTFWGPAAGRPTPQGPPDAASRWIAEAARWIESRHQPTLSLVYLPHLDYNLQRLGPLHPNLGPDLQALDRIVGDLVTFFQRRHVRVLILSEYGITPAHTPLHPNRLFRQQGWLTVKDELGRELLDPGASRVFAVADHQVAHVYVKDPADLAAARSLLAATPGVARVLDRADQQAAHLAHPRSGDLLALAEENAWFTYYYWDDDRRAPDFARTVDIHRKPGYDPVELFLDPTLPAVKLRIAWRLLQKKLGFRMLMDVVPLDASLVRGSHGTCPANRADWPILLTNARPGDIPPTVESTDLSLLIQRSIQNA